MNRHRGTIQCVITKFSYSFAFSASLCNVTIQTKTVYFGKQAKSRDRFYFSSNEQLFGFHSKAQPIWVTTTQLQENTYFFLLHTLDFWYVT